jgi:hypothetical protein
MSLIYFCGSLIYFCVPNSFDYNELHDNILWGFLGTKKAWLWDLRRLSWHSFLQLYQDRDYTGRCPIFPGTRSNSLHASGCRRSAREQDDKTIPNLDHGFVYGPFGIPPFWEEGFHHNHNRRYSFPWFFFNLNDAKSVKLDQHVHFTCAAGFERKEHFLGEWQYPYPTVERPQE